MPFAKGNKLPRFTGMKHRPESNAKRSETMRRLHAEKKIPGMGFKPTLTENERSRGRRSASMKHKYGITLLEYEAIYDLQEGKCAICGYESNRTLVIDHCHETGKVRGLLCQPCNLMLGAARDSLHVLTEASLYLLRNETMTNYANETVKSRLNRG